MNVKLVAIVMLGVGVWGWMRANDPMNTKLPFGTTDLSSVQDALQQLEEKDRVLVEGYVRRTNGDYLPPGMGDPDDPITARNFREARELQLKFLEKMAVQQVRANAMQAKRDEVYAPLRKAVKMRMVRREIMTRGDALKMPHQRFYLNGTFVTRTPDDKPIQVSTYSLENMTETKIELLRANIDVRKANYDPSKELGYLSGCYMEYREGLLPGDVTEIQCAFINREAGGADQQYVAMPESDLNLIWEPREIHFADGRKLEYRDPN